MSKLTELTTKIEQWSIDRNLHTADPRKQMLKLGEETGELYAGIAKNNDGLIKDSIGDAVVVMTILSQQKEIDFNKLVESVEKMNWTSRNDLNGHTLTLMHHVGMLAAAFEQTGGNTHIMMRLQWVLESLIDICEALDLDLIECVELAYNEIKDRKGKMIDGVFVKEADLQEVER
ncbi:MazG-like family protein [Macrococcus bovicus]|nr:MazG-like family protein [Macrococcus bovicus]